MTENKLCEPQKSSLGMEGSKAVLIFWLVAGVLAIFPYTCILAFVCPLVFLILEKESNFVRFHALQCMIYAIVFGVATLILGFLCDWSQYVPALRQVNTSIQTREESFLPMVNVAFLPYLPGLVMLVLAFLVFSKANTYEAYKLPIAGPIAEKKYFKEA